MNDTAVPHPDAAPALRWLVAIGASAGGLDPLRALLGAARPRNDTAIVVAQHLSGPDGDVLVQLLQRSTAWTVRAIADGDALTPGTVHVCPPGLDVDLEDTRLRLRRAESLPRPSIDRLFAAIARTHGAHAIGIVLSGTGNDGLAGARDIHGAGGAVWLQDPATCAFPSMPRALLDAGLADMVGTPAALGRRLQTLPGTDAPGAPRSRRAQARARQLALDRIAQRVGQAAGLDLTRYQGATLRRQFERVMRDEGIPDWATLSQRLDADPELLRRMAAAVSVGVTQWLRDPAAFLSLRAALRERLARAGPQDTPVRVWSCACATGQETYSLAMLLDDLLRELGLRREFLVIGTDVQPAYLATAREALYPLDELQHLPAEWRQRYLESDGTHGRVVPELRRRCLFVRHDVTQDLPFARIDVVACRNLLIYLKPTTKAAVLGRLHHALLDDGLLLLGAAEGGARGVHELFEPVAGSPYLFRRRPGASPRIDWTAPIHAPAPGAAPASARAHRQAADTLETSARERLLDLLIERYAPATVLADAQGHPLHLVGSVQDLLRWPRGPSVRLTVTELVPAEWQRDVSLALQQVLRGASDRFELPLPALPPGHTPYALQTQRVTVQERHFVALSFIAPARPVAAGAAAADGGLEPARQDVLINVLEQAQRELQEVNDRLQAAHEQLEVANEELEASNEELQASNEELRSLNEQLDQSLREQRRLNELLDAVLRHSQQALLVLDAQGRVLRYNARAAQWLGVTDADIGQAWSFGRGPVAWPQPDRLLRRLLAPDLTPTQEEVLVGERHYLLQMAPWHTRDARAGVLLAVSDLTEVRRVEAQRLALQARLSALTNALQEAVLMATPGLQQLQHVSPRLAEWLGTSTETLLREPARLRAAIAPEDRDRVLARWEAADDTEWQQRYHLIGPDGQRRLVLERAARADAEKGETPPIAASLLDITEAALVEQRERATQARMRALWHNPNVGMAMCDVAGRLLEVNDALARLLNTSVDALVGQSLHALADVEERLPALNQWQAVVGGAGSVALEMRLRAVGGDPHWVRRHLTLARDPERGDDFVVVILENLDEVKAREQTIYRQANFDPLTGLPNRNLLRDRLLQALRREAREGGYVFVLFLDLDGFKEVNDLYGHDSGDALLIEAAQRLRGCLRPADTVARFGGDEFVVLIDGANGPMAAERVGHAILEALRRPFDVPDNQVTLTASVGIATFPTDSDNADELLRLADTAMYAAKAQGKDRLRFFSPHMDSATRRQSGIKLGIERALVNDEFELYFQPVIALPLGQPIGAEALLRWRHPERGLVPPGEFIPVAETTGQIRRLGAWALREVARLAPQAAQRWGTDFRLAVNLSVAQFGGPEIEAWRREHEAVLPHLVMEVTESLLMQDNVNHWRWLMRLREAGAQIALDDFGTGYSSLAYLQRLTIDYLKLDKSFTEHVGHGGPSERIVQAVFDIAGAVGAHVIVEGLEREEQWRFFQPMAPLHVQGYYCARPMPWDALVDFMADAARPAAAS
ncbi:EAL domain-containing protein [Tepidimonas taiwanensis]|uniref:Putative signaling protein n=1 Tax=Tepidimonas taiwanensis TaxID=307486 RepID=A0A554XD15_9BURK|nr:EAL domain-containing protein [Tepidimonas taiwanensis]MCX7693521.1 EAL domain-containing protein [Tepidimonas taiwanensis]TSE33730.1 putative signaling protein [Tepidimonas taiwanensis]UBQ06721.1 EAL domain-containing protein [Tepidimonas taiwanensis]